jgi:TonB-linked SusC/RagA family outer membrane protein
MRKLLLFLCCAILFIGEAAAQDRTITGTVTDVTGAPVAGASITIKGTNRGANSDADGKFSIPVPAGTKTLVITSVNLAPLEINISNKSSLGTIRMETKNSNLDEVVVVAYGTSKKTDLTSSVAVVKGDFVADKPYSSVDKTLQGAVAGLQVSSTSGAPGSNTSIALRGIGSISASSSPLWVIDGVVATTGDLTTNQTTANALSTLNPDDIESISVLKDAAAASLYGSLAANGVILVTTKRGKAGKTHFSLIGEVGSNSQAFHPTNKSLSSAQAQTVFRQAVINAKEATDNASADTYINQNFGVIPNYQNINTNWLDVVTQTGNQSQYNLSMSAGTDKTTVYASGGYFNQVGTVIASNFKRYNGSIAVTHKASDRFMLSANLSGATTLQNTPLNGGFFANPVLNSFFLQPWYTPKNPDGTLRFSNPALNVGEDSLGEFVAGGGLYNPLVQAAYNTNPLRQTTIRGSFSGELKILDNLKLTSRYAAEYFDISEDQYQNPFYGDGQATNGFATSNYKRIYDYTWSNFVDFRQALNKNKDFNFDFKAGVESYAQNVYLLQAQGQAFPQTLLLKTLASAATPILASALPSSQSRFSEFGQANFNYKDRYIVSGSFRRDGASVFGANKLYGNFYSVGASWNISEEAFFKENVTFINLLKLRSSYGSNGNSNGFGFYSAIPTYGFGYNYTGQPGSAPANPGNPNLTWETNKPFNLGLDFGLLKDRISGTVEYYHRTTSNLLLPVTLSYTTGVINPASGGPTQNENVGGLVNKGLEFTLNLRPIVTRDFSWTVSFNIAHNVNRVTALYHNNPLPSTLGNFQYTVGHDLLTYYLRQWDGVNPADGTPQWFTDSSRKATTGTYSSAKQALNYSASPKIYGAFGTTLSYKGLSLDAQFNYNFGNYLYDTWGSYLESEGTYYGAFNQRTEELQAWQKPGDKTNVPQLIDGGNHNSYRGSTRWLDKGDYVRLRNLQISYSIPKDAISRIHLGSVSFYVRGENIWTFATAKNLPFDPESGVFSRTNLEVFPPKTFTGGVKIGF